MNFQEKRPAQPEEKKKFRNLREMDLHILTELYGAEEAAGIMELAKALGQFYRTSKIKYSA